MSYPNRILRAAGFAASLALTAFQAQAQAIPGGTRAFMGLGVMSGGDTLVTVQWTDGTTKNIKSGNGVDLRFGYDVTNEDGSASLQFSVGYFTDAANGNNGRVHFDRYPVELIGFWNIASQMRLGVGARLATGAKLRSSGAASLGGSVDFKAKPGGLIEVEYAAGNHFAFTVRAVAEKYQVNNAGTVDGKHFGFRMNYFF